MKRDVSIGSERAKTGRQLSQTNLCASIDKRDWVERNHERKTRKRTRVKKGKNREQVDGEREFARGVAKKRQYR